MFLNYGSTEMIKKKKAECVEASRCSENNLLKFKASVRMRKKTDSSYFECSMVLVPACYQELILIWSNYGKWYLLPDYVSSHLEAAVDLHFSYSREEDLLLVPRFSKNVTWRRFCSVLIFACVGKLLNLTNWSCWSPCCFFVLCVQANKTSLCWLGDAVLLQTEINQMTWNQS